MRVKAKGIGIVPNNRGLVKTETFDLKKIMQHGKYHHGYHTMLRYGTLRLNGYQYGFINHLDKYVIEYLDGTLTAIYALNRQHAIECKERSESPINFIIKVKKDHYVS